jgi:undecaprenyl-diphosphatase
MTGGVRAWHRVVWIAAVGVLVVALTALFDRAVVGWMPRYGTSWLWPIALFSDLARPAAVIVVFGTVVAALCLSAAVACRAATGRVLASLAIRAGYVFAAVAVANLVTWAVKGAIGRGRPSASGGDAFLFSPFAYDVRFESFPSGHAATAFAAAYAIAALWPCMGRAMWGFAAAIAASRVVLMAHHPSDVLGGALVGVVSAMLVQIGFAERRRAFLIRPDGYVVAYPGPGLARLKRVVGALAAP